jgi:hypothetical protein
VVSHLASRLGVNVQLEGRQSGLVARLVLPATLLAPGGAVELDPPAPARMLASNAARGAAAQRGPGVPPSAGVHGPAAAPLDLPVAGRPPAAAVPRQTRPVPVRAEDVLAPAAASAGDGGGWWSRQGPTTGPVAPAQPVPPATPVTAGTNERGLPVRVPMAQLSAVTRPAQPESSPPRADLDPDAVGGMLSRLYSGVRRAEAEDTTEIPVPPSWRHDEGGRRQ